MMKRIWMIPFLLLCLVAPVGAFDSGSTGADGAFSPTANTEVVLPADGKLNYTTVNIPTGVTVTFKKNDANTPVYMLATGNVTIVGTINISGIDANGVANGRGGPGGFDGGLGASPGTCGGVGLGPGGGKMGGVGPNGGSGGGGGGFASSGTNGLGDAWAQSSGGTGGLTYGNISILPLIGGSGGGGGCGGLYGGGGTGGAGGGGGGAILIAASGTINVSGSIVSNGGISGSAGYGSGKGGGGSGGAIKLLANVISGNGTLSASAGSGSSAAGLGNSVNGGNGANGRIRLEANTLQRTASSTPAFTYLDAPVYVFPPNMPVLKITSIGGTTVPSAPTGKYSAPDILLPTNITNPVSVSVEGNNIPAGTTVTISSVSQLGASTSKTAILAGTTAVSTATTTLTLSAKYVNIISVSATFTVIASNQMPVFAGGDRIAKMRVDSVLGGSSSVTYITESGKEILAEM